MTIDLTPTWTGILPVMLRAYRDTNSFESMRILEEEFIRMAKLADAYNREMKER